MTRGVTIDEVYHCAYGRTVVPYPFQRAIAEDPGADVLIASTGLGKTAAVTLGWVWRRLRAPASTPRRLVWCLPMRTLVEQAARETEAWMGNLNQFFTAESPQPSVHVLMGGAVDSDWRLRPEDPAIIVGTQDMLLSRALMRGYGMSRFGWPVDYGLLHSDALWVYDEVQLMGVGLATSAQLEAFRRRPNWRRDGLARSLWMSATLDPEWLNTAEFRREIPRPVVLRWDDGHPPEPPDLAARLDAVKSLLKAETALTADGLKRPDVYAKSFAREVASAHRNDTTTLVIVNTVRRAQAVYQALAKLTGASTERLLIHSRYRPPDRRALEERLRAGADANRIVIATQAVEAGVDMTSATLFTELAPWSSLVQRFGRCNRRGELNALGGAEVRWIDAETDGDGDGDGDGVSARPYDPDELAAARNVLESLKEVSPRNLPPPSRPAPPKQVIRPKDFEELFDTDSDLSGYDLDISPYIRDGDDMSVMLFWRQVGTGERVTAERPRRDELCAAPLGTELQAWLKPKGGITSAFIEDPLASGREHWVRLDKSGRRLRPGLALLLDVEMCGYDSEFGFMGAEGTTPVESVPDLKKLKEPARGDDTDIGATNEGDPQAFGLAVPLDLHLDEVTGYVRKIAAAVGLPSAEASALTRASTWHDLGKAYSPFQTLLGRAPDGPLLAKSAEKSAPPARQAQAKNEGLHKYFRHELASALAFLRVCPRSFGCLAELS